MYSTRIQKDAQDQLDLIKRIVKSIESKSYKHVVDDCLRVATPIEFLYIYTHLNSKTQKDSIFRKLFIDFFQSLETAFPAGAFVGAKVLSHDTDMEWSGPFRMNASDLMSCLDDLIGHEASSVVKELIRLGGMYRSIAWDETIEDCYSLEMIEGNTVDIDVDSSFAKGLNKNISEEKSFILMSDCVFEKMSEIDALVRGAIEDGLSILLVSRGFLPEVSFTLLHNYNLGRSKIIPCTIESNDCDPFKMLDVAKMLGAQIIPSPVSVFTWKNLKGLSTEMLSYKIVNGVAKIVGNQSQDISDLIDQVMNDNREEISNPIRANRLLGNCIRIKVPKKSDDISKSRIKKGIILYRQWAKFGVFRSPFLSFPVASAMAQKVEKSSVNIKESINSVKFCIRIRNGVEKKVALS